jgi:hypothetical protein
MALLKGYKDSFYTLLRAAKNGDLALMECDDKQTNKKAAVVCAVNRDGGGYEFIPLAVLPDGNPYQRFVPPK